MSFVLSAVMSAVPVPAGSFARTVAGTDAVPLAPSKVHTALTTFVADDVWTTQTMFPPVAPDHVSASAAERSIVTGTVSDRTGVVSVELGAGAVSVVWNAGTVAPAAAIVIVSFTVHGAAGTDVDEVG